MEKKICWVPLFGSIIFFLQISKELKSIEKLSKKQQAGYLFAMGFLGGIGMLVGILFIAVLNLPFIFPFYLICVLCAWPLITLPVIEYSKKADKIIFFHMNNDLSSLENDGDNHEKTTKK